MPCGRSTRGRSPTSCDMPSARVSSPVEHGATSSSG
jgi:hypothetical protein